MLLASENFDEVVSDSRDANGSLSNHSHRFEAKALIAALELRIRVDGVEKFRFIGCKHRQRLFYVVNYVNDEFTSSRSA
jgi:hypothetical protein